MSNDDITPIKPIPIGPPPTLGLVNYDLTITFKRDLGHCFHQKIICDATKREVYCRKCHKIFDPYEALGHLARSPQSFLDEIRSLQVDVKRWRIEAVEAKRQRDNAVAARKRVETPEAKLMREIVAKYEDRPCEHGDGTAKYCTLCQMRAVLGRAEAPTVESRQRHARRVRR